jgi:phosphoribosylamine--glycine ligase
MPKKVLIVGGGGREHALAWACGRDASCPEILIAPGNAGTAEVGVNIPIQPHETDALLSLARDQRVDLTVVGPEVALERGVVDAFTDAGLAVVGPTKAAAALETSKAFAKAFMARHGVPTAQFQTCETPADAIRACDAFGYPVVVKADGLAAGKGVVVAATRPEAHGAIHSMLVTRQFGDAGRRVVIEECLVGPEVSVFVLTDGRRTVSLGAAHDHKRIFDGDKGPNTGGMGAYSPSPLLSSELEARIQREIIEPTLSGMREEGQPFRGFLYAGLMLTATGPQVIEFNVRLGDPETQVVLPQIRHGLLAALASAARGDLDTGALSVEAKPHVGVVLASGGYPERYETGKVVRGLEAVRSMPDVHVFHAGTRAHQGQVVTAGGRVLTVVASGASFAAAIARVYGAVDELSFEGMHLRTDIGRRALTP